jgi:hypothetical protein
MITMADQAQPGLPAPVNPHSTEPILNAPLPNVQKPLIAGQGIAANADIPVANPLLPSPANKALPAGANQALPNMAVLPPIIFCGWTANTLGQCCFSNNTKHSI